MTDPAAAPPTPMHSRAVPLLLGLCAALLVFAALAVAQGIIAPVVFALFLIAISRPLQRVLERFLPRLLAVLVTLLAALAVIGGIGSFAVWGFARAGHWLVHNAALFQSLYLTVAGWLEQHDLYAAGLLAERFNVSWLIRVFQEIGLILQALGSFVVVTFVFVLLGLIEVDDARNRLATIRHPAADLLLAAGAASARKFQTYMLVRTLMSALTGLAVFAFVRLLDLDLAAEWGVIAFALNYIPFIGPLVATVLPTLFAAAQTGSWQMPVLVLVGLNVIQFMIGSYLEPRFAGARLAVSPFMVLFAVFFWAFLWGVPGAFIGVPILIAVVTFCEHSRSGRWVATLLGARPDPARDAAG